MSNIHRQFIIKLCKSKSKSSSHHAMFVQELAVQEDFANWMLLPECSTASKAGTLGSVSGTHEQATSMDATHKPNDVCN